MPTNDQKDGKNAKFTHFVLSSLGLRRPTAARPPVARETLAELQERAKNDAQLYSLLPPNTDIRQIATAAWLLGGQARTLPQLIEHERGSKDFFPAPSQYTQPPTSPAPVTVDKDTLKKVSIWSNKHIKNGCKSDTGCIKKAKELREFCAVALSR
jgi:hypothetical protein